METTTNYVYCISGKRKTKFTETVWKNMGQFKNGWKVITESQFHDENFTVANVTEAPKSIKDDTRKVDFSATIKQAKGLEKDGKLAEALVKYQEAIAVKSNPKLLAKVEELKTAIQNEVAYTEFMTNAQAIEHADVEGALAFYKEALELKPDSKEAAEAIAKLEK